MDYEALKTAVYAEPECATHITNRDCKSIADIMSVGRTRTNNLEVGNGTILSTIGFAAGNALLDEINTNVNYRYVKPLVEQGRLLIGTPLVVASIQSLVTGGIITQTNANNLIALGRTPNPYTIQEISTAIFNDDGSLK